MKKEYIDLCHFGELWDMDGDATFESNLAEAFEFLTKKKLLEDKKKKYLFLVSKISYKGEIHRYREEAQGTIRKLLNYWRITFGKSFSKNSLKDFSEKKNFEIEMLEKEGERRGAWGAYGAIVRAQNEVKEYAAAERLPSGKKEKELERLKNRTNFLVIG